MGKRQQKGKALRAQSNGATAHKPLKSKTTTATLNSSPGNSSSTRSTSGLQAVASTKPKALASISQRTISPIPPVTTTVSPRDSPGLRTPTKSVKIVLPQASTPRTAAAPYTRPPRSGECLFFERLPGEIRNQIYDYVIAGVFVAEGGFRFWTKCRTRDFTLDKRKPWSELRQLAVDSISLFPTTRGTGRPYDMEDVAADLRLCFPDLPSTICHRSTNTALYNMGRSKRTLTATSSTNFALLFVNRQAYEEILPLVYSKSVFALRHQWRVRELLFDFWKGGKARSRLRPRAHVAASTPFPAHGLQWIRSVCVEIDEYNRPAAAALARFERRYYDAWDETLRRLAQVLPRLERVALFVHVPWTAPGLVGRLSFDESWAAPLLALRASYSLKSVDVRLHSSTHPFPRLLAAFAEYLRRVLLRWDAASAVEALRFGRDEYLATHASRVAGTTLTTPEARAWRQLARLYGFEGEEP